MRRRFACFFRKNFLVYIINKYLYTSHNNNIINKHLSSGECGRSPRQAPVCATVTFSAVHTISCRARAKESPRSTICIAQRANIGRSLDPLSEWKRWQPRGSKLLVVSAVWLAYGGEEGLPLGSSSWHSLIRTLLLLYLAHNFLHTYYIIRTNPSQHKEPSCQFWARAGCRY